MKFVIESGTPADIDELEELYDNLNDYLSATTNYPGWIKGIYPVRENAVAGIEDNTLFVLRCNGKIAGSIILDHHPDEAYNSVSWKVDVDYSSIFENNLPAISLYEKCGFEYIDTVDLGLGNYGLNWFKLYEKVV